MECYDKTAPAHCKCTVNNAYGEIRSDDIQGPN